MALVQRISGWLGRLSVGRKLMLIYLLDLSAVIYVSGILIHEKFLAIDFTDKETVGSAYTAAASEALMAVFLQQGDVPLLSPAHLQALAAVRQRDEAACYKQFAVEDCLRSVRTKAREAGDRLRAQEVELNDAERREKAAERLRSIEEKQKAVPPPAARGQGTDATVRKTPASPASTKAQRDHEAEQRAQLQRNRVDGGVDQHQPSSLERSRTAPLSAEVASSA